jgi:hypothetical protein
MRCEISAMRAVALEDLLPSVCQARPELPVDTPSTGSAVAVSRDIKVLF